MANAGVAGDWGVILTLQTESPTSVNVQNWTRGRARKYGQFLEGIACEGRATYIPGHRCRGGWGIDGLTEVGMTLLQRFFGAPINVYDYAPEDHERYPIPEHLAHNPRFVLHEGYYSKRVDLEEAV